jgi:cell division protein FtsL
MTTGGALGIVLLVIAFVAIRLQKQINQLKKEANRLQQKINEDEKKETKADDDLK